ncbi:hypothetical protein LOX59_00230 [Latilactobacillus curvatus]|uniref:hypothetical protein n=1 Tax=Latilactobacillus curvatus TaxID=28038 RepID=UPI0020C7A32E|nr:hypothetical protein [Latilactobacillus curvatus]MCP8876509.1 hypothetical protein [Latilactobacillus curvatus]
MTMVEYQLRLEAYQLKKAEQQESIALQAWMNQAVQATTGGKKPRPKFKSFTEFFDRQSEIDRVRSAFEADYKISHLSKADLRKRQGEVFAKRMREFSELKKQGKIIPLDRRKEKMNG